MGQQSQALRDSQLSYMQQRRWVTAECVNTDVDVDDVDDDDEGAAAYFFWSETAMMVAIPTVNYKSVEDKPFY